MRSARSVERVATVLSVVVPEAEEPAALVLPIVPPVAVVEELEAGGFVVIVPGAVPVPGVLVRSVDDAPPWLPELAAPELAPVPDAPVLPALPPVDCACASPSSATAAIVAREVTSVFCDMVDLLKK